MAESTSLSKNQKKRARKKQKKAVEADEGGPSSCADVTCAVSEGGGVKREEEKVVVKDPVEELKKKLSEAKASQDHEMAQQLREDLWKLRDNVLAPADLSVSMERSGVSNPTVESLDTAVSTGGGGDPLEKKMSKLKKKLRQVEMLEELQAKGEELEANQLTKIATKQELLQEISDLENILSVT